MRNSASIRLILLSPSIFCGGYVYSADLPVELQAKFIKILIASSGSTGIDVVDAAMGAALGKEGVKIDATSRFAYVASEGDLKKFKGKLIICPNADWLKNGASIAIIVDGGKPAIVLHVENANASGVRLPDAILKSSKKI